MKLRRRRPAVPPLLTAAAMFATIVFAVGFVASVRTKLVGLDQQLWTSVFPPPPPTLWIAVDDLPIGHVLTPFDLEEHHFAGWTPPGSRSSIADLVGHTVEERILAGDVVRTERLLNGKGRPGLNALVTEGRRAMSIHLTHADRVAGFVEPGDYVDLLVTLYGDDGRASETVPVLQRVPVIAIDDRTATGKVGETRIKPQVTLLVSPDDAERLALSLRTGHPRLILRSEADG